MKMLSLLLRSHFVEWVCNIEYNLHIMAYPVRSALVSTHFHRWHSAQRCFVRLVASVSGAFMPVFFSALLCAVLLPVAAFVVVRVAIVILG